MISDQKHERIVRGLELANLRLQAALASCPMDQSEEIAALKADLALCREVHIGIEESLIRQRDKAEAEVAALKHELLQAHGVAQACEIRAEKAEAEVERLRAALDEILDQTSRGDWHRYGTREQVAGIAAAALGGKP